MCSILAKLFCGRNIAESLPTKKSIFLRRLTFSTLIDEGEAALAALLVPAMAEKHDFFLTLQHCCKHNALLEYSSGDFSTFHIIIETSNNYNVVASLSFA